MPQIIYLMTTFGIIPSRGLYLGTVMFYISVRIRREFTQVITNSIFFQSTYPVSVNVLAVTTQSYKFSEV